MYIVILQDKFRYSTIMQWKDFTLINTLRTMHNFILIRHTISIEFLIWIILSYLVKKEWIGRAMHYAISQISINFIFGLFPIIAVRMLIQIDLTWLSCRTNGFSYQLTIFSLIASLYSFRVFLCLISFISRCP